MTWSATARAAVSCSRICWIDETVTGFILFRVSSLTTAISVNPILPSRKEATAISFAAFNRVVAACPSRHASIAVSYTHLTLPTTPYV